MSKPIQIVDENDQPIGSATKQQAWQQGLIHRIVRIMLWDVNGNVLLQHRDPSKDIFPSCWDNSAAGHVDADEDYDTAAYRELHEELGIEGVKLKTLGTYRTDETLHGHRFNRFTTVYEATIDTTPQALEQHKVDAVRWFTLAEAEAIVANQPDQVTDGLRQVIQRYYGE